MKSEKMGKQAPQNVDMQNECSPNGKLCQEYTDKSHSANISKLSSEGNVQ